MKKLFTILLSLGLVVGLSFSVTDSAEAKVKIKTYKNCTALNKDFKGGVARTSKVKNKGGKTKYRKGTEIKILLLVSDNSLNY
jgi:hypothetical protein